jgi:hypothetical protein
LLGVRKAKSFPHQPVAPSAQCELFAFQALRHPLADHRIFGIQMRGIGSSVVGEKAAHSKRGEQGFELQKRPLLTPTKDIGHYLARPMIQRHPQLTRLLLTVNKRLHFVQLSLRHLVHHRGVSSLTSNRKGGVHVVESTRFF